MKITITGGKGFIGEPTAREAERLGHEVAFFDRKDGNDILGPLDALEGSDAVIHLAGLLGTHELFDNIQEAIDVNITGSYRVMDWCLKHNATYVNIMMLDVFPSIYTLTKNAAYRLAEALRLARGLKVSHVRSFNAFGPGQAYGDGHPQKLIPWASVAAWRREPIQVWGDGHQGVDLVYVDDVAKLLVAATGFTDGEMFDAGTGVCLDVNTVVAMILAIANSDSEVVHLPMRDGEVPTQIKSPGTGLDLLDKDHQPMLRHEDMVKTVEWYKRYA